MYHLKSAAVPPAAGGPAGDCLNGRRLGRLFHAVPWRLAVLPLGCLLGLALITGTRPDHTGPREPLTRTDASGMKKRPAPKTIGKHEVRQIIADRNVLNLTESTLKIPQGNDCYTVQTSIDPGLQDFLVQHLDRRHSRYIGIVVMDASDGRILAMAGYDRDDPSRNPCLDSRFPAASIFKIITAAAAVETCDLEADSALSYEGRKHTLYRSQVRRTTSKHANRASLRDSFAQSINPVFGSLGAYALGRNVIETYAEGFGFNREIDFELPTRPSRLEVSDTAYTLAEVASGFNRTTRISPLHGALIAATILNAGRLIEPTIVDWIDNEAGQTLYQSRTVFGDQVLDPDTCGILQELMQATVRSGTAKREFHTLQEDRLLSQVEIGGKTGSIGDGSGDARYDWFVGYARAHAQRGGIVLSAVVAHEEFIGMRAAAYAAETIKMYFRNHIAGQEQAAESASRS
jgi:cell division protein FtsI/penicillin-binding protein 2